MSGPWDDEDDVVQPSNGRKSAGALLTPPPLTDTAGIIPGPLQVPPPPVAVRAFPSLEAWVTGWYVKVFARHPGGGRWCPMWWDHPEAVHRLKDLYWAWEVLRLKDDLGMSTWLEQLDRQRDRLSAPDGPFSNCDAEQHHRPPDLPVVPAPAGYWDQTGD